MDKIIMHGVHGRHKWRAELRSPRDVQLFFLSKGYDTEWLLEYQRNARHIVPELENATGGSTWKVSGGVSLFDKRTSETVATVKNAGLLIESEYQAHFEAACNSRDRAVNNGSYFDLLDCISRGFASIESFLNHLASCWNEQNPDDLLVDNTRQKVSLESKIFKWLPKISSDFSLNKQSKHWSDFKALKRVRDNQSTHPKESYRAIDAKMMARLLNAFRGGVAMQLLEYHAATGLSVPGCIINAVYMPDVLVDRG